MVSSCSSTLTNISNHVSFGWGRNAIIMNYYSLMSQFTYNQLLFGFILLFSTITFFLLVINSLKNNLKIKSKLILNERHVDKNNRKCQQYLLFFGSIVPLLEFSFEILNLRPAGLLVINCSICFLILCFYFISKKSFFVLQNIQQIFTVLYIGYFAFIAGNLIFRDFDIITIISFITFFYFSYSILKPIKRYWLFVAAVFIYLSFLFAFKLVSFKVIITLFYYSIVVVIINYLRHISMPNSSFKWNFTNEIVNKGNMLTLATNKNGEISFCSDTIMQILGYTPKEVMGMGFWELTEDPEFTGLDFHSEYTDDIFYTRKLKCKNGDYKYIQWKDKKISDELIIGIGQDITDEIRVKNQYKNLIQNATDIIFEIDNKGNYTFINEFTTRLLGFNEDEILSRHFSEFIRKDYIQMVVDFYSDRTENNYEFPTIEFPVLKKNGEDIWVSQKVTALQNDSGKIIGYSGIARDISIIKKNDEDRIKRHEKIQKYSETLNNFTLKSYSTQESFDDILKNILRISSKTIEVDQASYWTYSTDKIECLNMYELRTNSFKNGFTLTSDRYPEYFYSVENEKQVIVSDIVTNRLTQRLTSRPLTRNKVYSLLDTPVFINGKIKGIFSFETTNAIRNWDQEDINFARSISDLIVIAIESQMRFETEKRMAYKSELLSAMSLCTKKFLSSKSQIEIFENTYPLIGNVINADNIYYYENDEKAKLILQKYKWCRDDTKIQISSFRNFTHDHFFEIAEQTRQQKNIIGNSRELKDSSFKNQLILHDIKSFLIIPIFIKEELTGFLGLDDRQKERVWSEDEINILQTLASNIASAIERIANENIIYESEEKFRLLANNIPGTVYLSKFDDFSTKIYLNNEIEKLTGYPKSEFLENKLSFIDIIHPEDKKRVLEENIETIKSGKTIHSIYRIIRKNMEIVWVEEFGEAIRKDGKITFIEGIYIDITERKLNEAVIKEKELAKASNKAKSDFLANMSHEIRTPLNGIIGFTDLLMNTQLEDFQKQYMGTINQSANLLMEIINDILDFSKIESGKLELNIEKHNTIELSKQVLELVKYESNTKKIDLILNIEENVPKYIWIDSIRLKQVLINLLTNALKFTLNGKIEFCISTVGISKNKSVLRFSVKDTGIGIKKKNQNRIFQAFSQEDNSTTKKFGGTGLGLTISNQLLALMNSHLQLESTFTVGSTFFFDVEFRTSNELSNSIKKKPEKIKSKVENIINEKYKNQQPNILIVEDNKINMLLAKTLVKQIIPNSIIHDAIDGKMAVIQYKNINPDIIIMDIQMPKMNGYEAAQEIRKLQGTKHIPIIALTASADVEEKEKCLKSGIDDYTSKPIVKETLEKIITKWLDVLN